MDTRFIEPARMSGPHWTTGVEADTITVGAAVPTEMLNASVYGASGLTQAIKWQVSSFSNYGSPVTTFAPGDVLHDEDDLVIGTVKSVTDANNLVLTENCASVSAVNKDLYNIHPIQLLLSGTV